MTPPATPRPRPRVLAGQYVSVVAMRRDPQRDDGTLVTLLFPTGGTIEIGWPPDQDLPDVNDMLTVAIFAGVVL